MRPLLVLFIVVFTLASSLARSCQEIGWRDLTFPIEPGDDPFFGLNFEQNRSIETLFEIARKKGRGELLTEADQAMIASATLELLKYLISAEDMLRKNILFLQKLKLQRNAFRSECGHEPVLIPGYILVLEFDDTTFTELLLVPYVGACIHVPPPPPNQIIHVTATSGYQSRGLFEPVWLEGAIEIKSSTKNLYLKDGSADIEVG